MSNAGPSASAVPGPYAGHSHGARTKALLPGRHVSRNNHRPYWLEPFSAETQREKEGRRGRGGEGHITVVEPQEPHGPRVARHEPRDRPHGGSTGGRRRRYGSSPTQKRRRQAWDRTESHSGRRVSGSAGARGARLYVVPPPRSVGLCCSRTPSSRSVLRSREAVLWGVPVAST